jgi:hypothetical protein
MGTSHKMNYQIGCMYITNLVPPIHVLFISAHEHKLVLLDHVQATTEIRLVYISYICTKGKDLQLCLVNSWGHLKKNKAKLGSTT